MTNWENFGRGRNGPYQKIRVNVGYDNSRVIRICNRCGILYVQKDFNAGYCPLCARFKAMDTWGPAVAGYAMGEIAKEHQDRREETA